MKNQTSKILAVIFLLLMGMSVSTVYAQSPGDTLNQYISDLQKNPNDYVLREKIIKLVQTMPPAPAIPEEARKYFIEGNSLLRASKEQKGYDLAIDSYRQCLLIAPWWGEAYYNYAVSLDLANQFDEGINTLKLYIATNPGEGESRKAQDKIYEIGAKKKIAAQKKEESSPQSAAVREQDPFEALLKKIDGRRYTISGPGGTGIIDVSGKIFVTGQIPASDPRYFPGARYEIRGRESRYTVPDAIRRIYNGTYPIENIYKISEDGDYIIVGCRWSDGNLREVVYRWQR